MLPDVCQNQCNYYYDCGMAAANSPLDIEQTPARPGQRSTVVGLYGDFVPGVDQSFFWLKLGQQIERGQPVHGSGSVGAVEARHQEQDVEPLDRRQGELAGFELEVPLGLGQEVGAKIGGRRLVYESDLVRKHL